MLIILLILIYLYNKKENMINTPPQTTLPQTTQPLSLEAIQNIASVYASTGSEAKFNKIKSIGGITGNLTGDVSGNLTGDVTGNLKGDVSGNVTSDKICIGKTCITEKDLQQIVANKKCAGFAIDGGGSTLLLYEGYWELDVGTNDTNGRFDVWTNNSFNSAYIFKGWKIVFYNEKKNIQTAKIEVDNSEIIDGENDYVPKAVIFNKLNNLGDGVSSYEATWVGHKKKI